MKIKSGSLLMAGLCLLYSGFSRADWEGSILTKVPGKDNAAPTELAGMIRMKKEKTRLDMKTPAELSIIVDLKSKKAWTLVHAQKLLLDSDLSQLQGQAPICSAADVDGCLKKQGFKKVGAETVDGHPCSIFEALMDPNGKKVHTKVWRPDDLKEVPSLKTLVTPEGQKTIETVVSNVKIVGQDAKLFVAPSDYRKLGNVQDLLKGLKSPF